MSLRSELRTTGDDGKEQKRTLGCLKLLGEGLQLPLGLAGHWSDPNYTLGKVNLGCGRVFLGVEGLVVHEFIALGEDGFD